MIVSVCWLAGCSATPSSQPVETLSSDQIKAFARTESKDGHTQQATILKDGSVSPDEYSTAFDSLRQCYELKGYTVDTPQINPITGLDYTYAVNTKGHKQSQVWKDLDKCEAANWNSVQRAYLGSHEHRMKPELVKATSQCLEARGEHASSNASNLTQMVASQGVTEKAAFECVGEEVTILYPEIISVTIAY